MMQYITTAGILLAGSLIFYKLLLQKETFFRANRWVLLACLVGAFALPLIQVPQQWSFRKAKTVVMDPAVEQPVVNNTNATITPSEPLPATSATTNNTRENKPPFITWQQALTWAGWLYWCGVIIFGINFLVQLGTLLYRAYTSPVIRDGRFRIVELTGDKAPCSFWNNIFINPEKYDWDTYNQIIQHEKIHIEQRHSLDLLLAELMIVVQWFNPFAWQYRKALENNLEYLTDDQLVNHSQVERAAYQLSLLKVSAPHFPLNLTTNYNQSLLKKRIAMMNVKKSNVHTAWKYGFLLPLLVLLVCLLNEPVAHAHNPATTKKMDNHPIFSEDIDTEGVWFATIRNNEVSMQFKSDGDDHSTNNTTFALSDLGELPRDKAGIFNVTREAGTVQFTGRFEGDQGMGRYKFTPNAEFAEAMQKEGIELRDDRDKMVFFLVNVTKGYVKMLKANGYTELNRNDVIPLAALKVDEAYIQSLKKSGIKDLSLRNLVPFKALGIHGDYIAEIRKAGYPDVTANQLISFKAQNIDAKYIADVRSATAVPTKPAAGKETKPQAGEEKPKRGKENGYPVTLDVNTDLNTNTNTNSNVSVNDLVSIKALNIDPAYIKSLKEAGFDDLPNQQLIAMKAQGITAEYIKGLKAAGFKDLDAHDIVAIKSLHIDADYLHSMKAVGFGNLTTNDLISMKAQGITADYVQKLQSAFKELDPHDVVAIKAQNITPEYAKSFETIGYKNLQPQDLISLKSLNVTPDYIKGFKDMGYNDIPPHQSVALKAQNVTPAFLKEFNALGLGTISLQDAITARATGTTPAFVKAMKEKGHDFKSFQKYMQLKTLID